MCEVRNVLAEQSKHKISQNIKSKVFLGKSQVLTYCEFTKSVEIIGENPEISIFVFKSPFTVLVKKNDRPKDISIK